MTLRGSPVFGRTVPIGGSGPDAQKGLFVERLRFALGCLVAGGEAARLGFDSYRIYPGSK